MHVSAYLLSRFQKLDRMLEFKLKVMIDCIGPKANFFNDRLLGVGFNFFLLLLLLVAKLAIVNDSADGRKRFGRYPYQIHLQFTRETQCLARGVYPLFHLFTTHPYLGYP